MPSILIADDSAFMRDLIQHCCDRMHLHAYIYSSGWDAVEAYRSHAHRTVRAAVLDVLFPGEMDGITAAQEMRKIRPDLPVLFVSAFDIDADPAIKVRVAGLGARWVKKPFYEPQLRAEIEGMLGG